MSANEQIAPAANNSLRCMDVGNSLLTVAMMCLAEVPLIRAYWFWQRTSTGTFNAFFLPCLALLPGIVGYSLLFAIRTRGQKGQIDSSTLAWLTLSLRSLIVIAYLTIGLLASELTRAAHR